MDKLRLILMIILVLPIVANASLFDCSSEVVLYNGTTEKWEAHFSGCPERPDWIVNESVIVEYTVNNCSEQFFYDAMYMTMDPYMERIDKRINCTFNIAEKQEALDSCQKEIGLSVQRESMASKYFVNKSELSACQSDLSNIAQMLETEMTGNQTNWVLPVLVTAAGMYFWFNKDKEKPTRSDIEPTRGVAYADPQKLASRVENLKLKSQLAELKRKTSEKED